MVTIIFDFKFYASTEFDIEPIKKDHTKIYVQSHFSYILRLSNGLFLYNAN